MRWSEISLPNHSPGANFVVFAISLWIALLMTMALLTLTQSRVPTFTALITPIPNLMTWVHCVIWNNGLTGVCWGYMYFWLQIGRRANHKLDGALTHQWRDNADVDNADNENRSIFTSALYISSSVLYISSYPAQCFLSIWRNMTAGWWADVSLASVAKIRLVKM